MLLSFLPAFLPVKGPYANSDDNCTCVLALGTFLSRPLQNSGFSSGFTENVNQDCEFFKFLFRIKCDLYIFSRG